MKAHKDNSKARRSLIAAALVLLIFAAAHASKTASADDLQADSAVTETNESMFKANQGRSGLRFATDLRVSSEAFDSGCHPLALSIVLDGDRSCSLSRDQSGFSAKSMLKANAPLQSRYAIVRPSDADSRFVKIPLLTEINWSVRGQAVYGLGGITLPDGKACLMPSCPSWKRTVPSLNFDDWGLKDRYQQLKRSHPGLLNGGIE